MTCRKRFSRAPRRLLLADPENLDPQKGQPEQLREARQLNEALSKAYYMKESLRQLWKKKFRETARLSLIHWYHQAMASGVRILQQFAKLLLANQDKLLAWYDHPITSAKTEATNNKLKTMQRMHYGLRDKQFFKLKLFQLHAYKVRFNRMSKILYFEKPVNGCNRDQDSISDNSSCVILCRVDRPPSVTSTSASGGNKSSL